MKLIPSPMSLPSLTLPSTSGTSAGGITFGTDTTLYRSAAGVLTLNSILAFTSATAAVVPLQIRVTGDSVARFVVYADGKQEWGAGNAARDTTLQRTAAGILDVTSAFQFTEIADPSAPAANKAVLYAKDNGAGKTLLVVRFPTGAVQTVATEP